MSRGDFVNIGIRLKDLREEEGLTQEEVGKAIGVTKATVNRYETEEIDIKRTVAIKLAQVLHTVPSYIMGWTDDKNPNSDTKQEPPILTKYNKLNNKKEIIEMPELSRFFNIIIRMIYNDTSQHHKPHIHVQYNEYEATIGIDGELLAGSLPVKQLRLVEAWIVIHEEELYKAWNNAVRSIPFDKIAPLS